MKVLCDGVVLRRKGKLVTMTFSFDNEELAEQFKQFMEVAAVDDLGHVVTRDGRRH